MTEGTGLLDSEQPVPVGDVTGEDRVAVVTVAGAHEAEFAVRRDVDHPASLPVTVRPLHPSAAILVPAGRQLTVRLVTMPPPGRRAVLTYRIGTLTDRDTRPYDRGHPAG